MLKKQLKKIIGVCLSAVFAFSLVLPVYAKQPDYEFDEGTGTLIIYKAIEKKTITHIVPPSIPQDKIVTVFIKEGVKKISDMAFMNCKNLQTVRIPNSIKSIGSEAFRGCTGLTSVTIPNSVISIGKQSFNDCTSLTSVTYLGRIEPPNFRNIFNGCTQLKEVKVPLDYRDDTFCEIKVTKKEITELTNSQMEDHTTSSSNESTDSQTSSIDVSKLKTEMINLIYPVGSIFMSTNSENPSTYLGGTWEAWGSGKVPVGVDTSDSDFSTVEKAGGEKTVKLKCDQLPPEFATVYWREKGQNGATYNADTSGWAVACAHHNGRQYDKGINNLQPYITCYMWKRTV